MFEWLVDQYLRWRAKNEKACRDKGFAFAMNAMLTTKDRLKTRDDLLMHVEDAEAFGGYNAFDDGIRDALLVFDAESGS